MRRSTLSRRQRHCARWCERGAAEIFRADEEAATVLRGWRCCARRCRRKTGHRGTTRPWAKCWRMLREERKGCEAVKALPLASILKSALPYPLDRLLEQEAPEALEVPSGSRIQLRYSPTEVVLAARLQELFGWLDTPRIAGGRVAVKVELLGPNYRPVQVTSDLRSFWATTYFQVRKDLKARYPKHAWPEDPLTVARRGKGAAAIGKNRRDTRSHRSLFVDADYFEWRRRRREVATPHAAKNASSAADGSGTLANALARSASNGRRCPGDRLARQRRVVVLRQLHQVIEIGDAVVGEIAVVPPALGRGRDGGVVVLGELHQVVEIDDAVERGVAGERRADEHGALVSTFGSPVHVPPPGTISDASA